MTNIIDKILKQEEQKFAKEMVTDTLRYQRQYGFDAGENGKTTWNNEADAFKHTYMQAYLKLSKGQVLAKYLGDKHEKQGLLNNQPSGEANMDLWNNRQGREIAEEIRKEYGYFINPIDSKIKNIIAQKVMDRMRAGKLITNPNDKRKFVETGFAAPIQENAEQLFSREDIAKMTVDEFAKNEKQIIEQMVNGKIKNEKPDYSKFTNPLTGRKKVFTKEEVSKMSDEEYLAKEQEIMAQANSIGLPEHREVYKTSSKAAASNGKWVTINGNHVLIDK